jgi:uncharacterized membrane protein YhaH (DUF805 family)
MFKVVLNSLTKNFLRFEGRCSRKEFTFFTLFFWTILISIYYCNNLIEQNDILNIISSIFIIFLFINDFAITARRLHDLNSSGWWQLILFFVPLAQILFIGLFFYKGTHTTNKYGDPPTD